MSIIAKYKFDGSVYADLIPEFNAEFTDYTVADEVDSENSNHIIRTIESDSLPTLIRFGKIDGDASNRELSLLEVLNLNISNLNNLERLFRRCENLSYVNCADWDISNINSLFDTFAYCMSLKNIAVEKWNTSNVVSMSNTFYYCSSLETLDVTGWNTSNIQSIDDFVVGCSSLKHLDLRNFNTSKVTSFDYMINSCSSLITLDISKMDMSSATVRVFGNSIKSLKYIKCNIPSTISTISKLMDARPAGDSGIIIYQGSETLPQDTIDTLQSKNWNIVTNPTLIAKYKYDSKIYKNLIPVFNEGYMGFVEDEEVDANGIVTRIIEHVELPTLMRFFNGPNINSPIDRRSRSLIGLDFLDISNLTSLGLLFGGAINLKYINCRDWNTSNITSMSHAFCKCYSLESLDLSKWDTRNVETIEYMLYETGATLDISNFNLCKIKSMNHALELNSSKDIGMIYCDKDTINKVASALPSNINRTIWVESDDILQYDQYDHITYKTQKVQDTVHLNSPLLKGDTIEVIDGKTYHVHRYEKIVLDGSEDWIYQDATTSCNMYLLAENAKPISIPICDRFRGNEPLTIINHDKEGIGVKKRTDLKGEFVLNIRKTKLPTQDVNGFKQWLQANPTTVVYELKTPYYELISEEPLELTLLDTTDNTINNNSILSSNMTIANKELSTIAIKSSTTYTLSFDKSIADSNIDIDVCGCDVISTAENIVHITTPSVTDDGIRFLSSDGCIISNVRLLEGSLVESAIPKETFEGLKNSFEDNVVTQAMVDKGKESIKNLGKYKAEYKVTGKNKFNMDKVLVNSNKYNDGIGPYQYFKITGLKPNTVYTFSRKDNSGYLTDPSGYITLSDIPGQSDGGAWICHYSAEVLCVKSVIKKSNSDGELYLNVTGGILNHLNLLKERLSEGQLEEGTVATEYEPYKEDIRTYYLSSPFLEGDTIEDVNGVATHVKRYEKVVLDGNENWKLTIKGNNEAYYFTPEKIGKIFNDISLANPVYSDRLVTRSDNPSTSNLFYNSIYTAYDGNICIVYNKLGISGIKQWLSENPVTVVYELDSPIYEPISTKSILMDSYVNGYLDVNTNVPIEKVEFRYFIQELEYLEPNTKYSIQFESDNIGECQVGVSGVYYTMSNVVKGRNICNIETPDSLVHQCIVIHGIGFNASNIQVVATENEFDYFKGLKSSFEDKAVNLIGEKIKLYISSFATQGIGNNSVIYPKQYVDNSVNGNRIRTELIEVNSNTEYRVINDSLYIAIHEFNSDGVCIKDSTWMTTTDYTFTTSAETTGLVIYLRKSNEDIFEEKELVDRDIRLYQGETQLCTGYKVEVKSVGKNKFNKEDFVEFFRTNCTTSCERVIFDGKDCLYVYGKFSEKSYIAKDCNPNKTYTLSISNYGIDSNSKTGMMTFKGIYVQPGEQQWSPRVIPGGLSMICFNYQNNAFYMDLDSIQLEEGSTATAYEPYKELTHTIYLNSPLLKGDTIEVVDGKLSHIHRWKSIILDGSEDEIYYDAIDSAFPENYINTYRVLLIVPDNKQGVSYTPIVDKFLPIQSGTSTTDSENIQSVDNIYIRINRSRLSTEDVNGVRLWLSNNPINIAYELANPIIENIEPLQDDLIIKGFKQGHLDIDTAVNPNVSFLPYKQELTYLYPDTAYSVRFVSNVDGIGDIYLGGTQLTDINIVKGVNQIEITTPVTLENNTIWVSIDNYAEISEVVVTNSTDKLGYFEGLSSTYEDKLIDDKYRVEIKTIPDGVPLFGEGGKKR